MKKDKKLYVNDKVYRHIFENLEEYAIFILDKNGNISTWNKGAERILGYKEEEIIGKNLSIFFPDQTAKKTIPRKEFTEAKEKGRSLVESWHVKADGTRFWASGLVLPLLDEKGELIGYTKIMRDLTERENIMSKLEKANKQAYEILGSISDAFIAFDKDWKYKYINESAAEMVGLKPKDLIGKTVFEVFPNIESNATFLESQKAMIKRKYLKYEYYSSLAKKWLEANFYPSTDGGLTAFYKDVTLQKTAINKLKESEERFRVMADSAPVMIWMSDIDMQCTYFNKGWLQFTGRKLKQELGNGWMDGVHKDDLEYCMKVYKDSFDKRQEYSVEYRLKRHDGQYRWILDTAIPRYSPEGEFLGYIGSCLDIHERKTIQERLKMHSLVLESMAEGVSLTDEKGIIQYTNPAEDQIFGYEKGELIGKSHFVQNIYNESQNKQLVKIVEESIAEKGYWAGEIVNKRKDGTMFTTSSRISSIEIDGKKHWICLQADITEKKISEDRLIESEERFRLALEAGKMGAWDWDILGGSISWTDKVYELHGVKKGEYDGSFEQFSEIIHPDDRAELFSLITKAVEKIGKFKAEFRVIWKDGSVHWLFTEAQTIANKKGKAVRMLGATFDITERKQAEINTKFLSQASKVLSSSLDYQITLNNIAKLAVPEIADWCSVDMIDENGEVKLFAVAHKDPRKVKWAKELRRQTPTDMTAKTGLPYVLKTGDSEFYPVITKEMIKAAAKSKEDFKLINKIGFKSLIIVPIKLRKRILGAITFVATETKKQYTKSDLLMAEELASRVYIAIENAKLYKEVEQEREKFKALFDSNIIGVFFADVAGNIFDANEAFLNLIGGYTYSQLDNKEIKIDNITPAKYSKYLKRAQRQLLNKGVVNPWEEELIKKDGTMVPVIIGGALLDKNSGDSVMFVLDITERKKLEERKDEFIGIASHELKTPLTSIKGYTQILERIVEEMGNDKAQSLLSKTNVYIDRLNSLIVDLLDVSKIQAGKLQFNMTEFDFSELVRDSIENMQETTSHKIECDTCYSKIMIFGDHHRLEQVFSNLLSNAVKYSPSAKRVEVDLIREKENIKVSVRDFGVGISKKYHKSLFQRFYRVEKTSKQFSGLGIGLYISSEIITRHGGKIWVESEEGKGSTFYFTLPILNSKK